ncbi:MAG: hypothetical protein K0Q54_2275 [Methylobacterium brachiatum]|nr:hypothetical protein [Methylobacterium brachiatum]
MGEPMKKSAKQPPLPKKNEGSNLGSNRPPLSRAKKARKRFLASEKSHETNKIDVAEEILGIALQYTSDNSAYQTFCQRTFFKNLANKSGSRLDLNDIANTVSQYVCKATIRRRKREAYKIGRVVDSCLLDKIEPWEFKDFIAGHGSFTKAYKYSVEKYSRSAEANEATASSSDIETEKNDNSQDQAEPSAADDTLKCDEVANQTVQDEKQTSNRKKPKWPKSERSLNSQATNDGDFAAVMAVKVEEDVWVRLRRRAFDGDYVDLCIKEVLPGHAVKMTRRLAED